MRLDRAIPHVTDNNRRRHTAHNGSGTTTGSSTSHGATGHLHVRRPMQRSSSPQVGGSGIFCCPPPPPPPPTQVCRHRFADRQSLVPMCTFVYGPRRRRIFPENKAKPEAALALVLVRTHAHTRARTTCTAPCICSASYRHGTCAYHCLSMIAFCVLRVIYGRITRGCASPPCTNVPCLIMNPESLLKGVQKPAPSTQSPLPPGV